MAKNPSDTSISDTDARAFIATNKDRAMKSCSRISGFHLVKIGTAGSWRYRYTDLLGRRRAVTIGNYPAMKPTEAAQMAMNWRNQKVDPLAEHSKRKASALAELKLSESRSLRAYLDGIYSKHQSRKKHAGVHTLQIIKGNFATLLDRDMLTISAADIKTWQLKREEEGAAYATLQRAYGALRTLLRHAVSEKILDKNPIDNAKLETQRADEKSKSFSADAIEHRRMLTPNELVGLFRGIALFADQRRAERRSSRKHGRAYLPDFDLVAYPHWFIPFFGLALHTGLRPGDLYTLTWQEINLVTRRLVKMPEKTMHHREPAKLDLPLTNDCFAIMSSWHQQSGQPKDGLVFPSPVESDSSKSPKALKNLDKKAHLKAWVRVLALGEVDPALHFYSLRHHFISALVASGAPMLAVAKLVGHKSTKMIEEHYGHLAPNAAADLMRTFSDSLKTPVTSKSDADANTATASS